MKKLFPFYRKSDLPVAVANALVIFAFYSFPKISNNSLMNSFRSSCIILASFLILAFLTDLKAQNTSPPVILSLQERAKVQNQWLEYRLQNVIPKLMRRAGIDMWIIDAREYNGDPVIKTMLPATWQSARRRTIRFLDNGKQVERLGGARYDIGEFSKRPGIWNNNLISGSN